MRIFIKFNYMHAWLQSGVLDSTKSYGLGNTVYGGKRLIYVPKFMATHFIELMPMKGLSFNIGESIVYTDNIELPFIIPISFFKAYDNSRFGDNISSGANGQIKFFGPMAGDPVPIFHSSQCRYFHLATFYRIRTATVKYASLRWVKG